MDEIVQRSRLNLNRSEPCPHFSHAFSLLTSAFELQPVFANDARHGVGRAMDVGHAFAGSVVFGHETGGARDAQDEGIGRAAIVVAVAEVARVYPVAATA